MSTKPDTDLDITAELPQLNIGSTTAVHHAGLQTSLEGTAVFEAQTGVTATLRVDAGEHWDLMDELISVRDKIVGLETALADAETKLTRLQTRHDTLQSQHADLLTHGQEVSRDRDRLAEERLLWLTTRQQLQDQLEQQRVETSAAILNLQQALEQQQRVSDDLTQQLAAQHAEAERLRQQHGQQLTELSRQLHEQQQRGESQQAELQATQQKFSEQHASAAALARSMAQDLLEKDALQHLLAGREQRIAVLESRLNDTAAQLASALANGEALVQNVARHQQEISDRTRQAAELQRDLALAAERIERLVSQVETENTHWRSAEQDKERLRQVADSERESFERTRRELTERQAEISTLQDKLSRAGAENDHLSQQLAERNSNLKLRDDALISRDRELHVLQESQAAQVQREAALQDSLAVLREELGQLQSALQQQVELHATSSKSLEEERQLRTQQDGEMTSLRQQLEQLQWQMQQRDKFVLEQSRELDGVNNANQELTEQIKHREQTVLVQAERIAELSASLQRVQDDSARQAATLQQAQHELDAKNLEQGASARQVESLQVELRQHVDAMNAIRRDIHQVALQTRKQDGEILLRTLSRDDVEGVVHLLNKNSMTLGRGHDADIRLQSDSVSRQHAILRISRDAVILEDMGSTNGCYVNGRRIKRQLLKDGDKLEVGSVPLRFGTRAMQS